MALRILSSGDSDQWDVYMQESTVAKVLLGVCVLVVFQEYVATLLKINWGQ